MSDFYPSVYGTEKDRVNCPFYYKIGSCRHGDKCSRSHIRPAHSQTILLKSLHVNSSELGPDQAPRADDGRYEVDDQETFDRFYEDIFVGLSTQYGEIEDMIVCNNLGEHLQGNVYVKFYSETAASNAANELNNRWYDGRPIYAELSPVADFRDSCCRQYDDNECQRNGFCNFMHVRKISSSLRRHLYGRSSDHRRSRDDRYGSRHSTSYRD